jgi:pimeloyl-ACP methyl ester carboxylesterase
VHGLAGQLQHMTYKLAGSLSDRYRVVCVDRPGCGYSERRPGTSARLSAQADTIAGLIRALRLDRPVVLGHSLGGAVALATALGHPDCVGGLALVAPLTHPQPDPPAALRHLAVASPLVRKIIAWTLATPMAMRFGSKALVDVFGPTNPPLDFGTRGGALLGLRPSAFYGASCDITAVNEDLPGMVERYPTLRLPVGILYGAGDRILDPKVQGEPMVGKVEGLTLEQIEGEGHMLPLVATEQTARFVDAVAARVWATAR